MATAKFRAMRLAAGPEDERPSEIYKCTGCGAETEPGEGWNGSPERGNCRHDCANRAPDYRPGRVTDAYRHGYDQIVWGSPRTART